MQESITCAIKKNEMGPLAEKQTYLEDNVLNKISQWMTKFQGFSPIWKAIDNLAVQRDKDKDGTSEEGKTKKIGQG